MTIEALRLPTSEYFMGRVKRKDGLEKPMLVDPKLMNIDFSIDPRLVGENRYQEKTWFNCVPVIIDEKRHTGNATYHLGISLANQTRSVSPENFIEYPHLIFDFTQYLDGQVNIFARKACEVQFHLNYEEMDKDLRPWLSIYRREMFGLSTRVKSPIELGYERDALINGMALILLPNEDINTRFVSISGDQVVYSSEQEFSDV